MRLVLAVGVLATWCACLQTATTRCGELVCAEDRVCAPRAARCVLPAELSACAEIADQGGCSDPGLVAGLCRDGVCVATWTPSVVPGAPTLVGVWASSRSNVYAIGTSAIFHYNGTAWTQVHASSETLRAAWARREPTSSRLAIAATCCTTTARGGTRCARARSTRSRRSAARKAL